MINYDDILWRELEKTDPTSLPARYLHHFQMLDPQGQTVPAVKLDYMRLRHDCIEYHDRVMMEVLSRLY